MLQKMTKEEFEKLVAAASEELPERIRAKIKNVAFLTEDKIRRRKKGELGLKLGESLLGLYEGVPRTERGSGYFGVLPDRITIFKEPIEEICASDPKKIRQLVFEVVWHEVGHYFGFDEPSIRKLEKERFFSNKFTHDK
ncbi:hypothetical protein A3A09_01755 [Candidatus Nomurabacteria bacterium RIFCSPLOWO2_01_FULL_42_20]|nr:MAG: hypothetical protein A3A09_01755 [Candidatus Nomurabacteria bacterium RIFCSPLOWO2_01_FULL_42_20]